MLKSIFLRPEAEVEAAKRGSGMSNAATRRLRDSYANFKQPSTQSPQVRPATLSIYAKALSMRFYMIKSYPYLVLYRERDEDVEVIAVAHARRRRGYWKDRLEN